MNAALGTGGNLVSPLMLLHCFSSSCFWVTAWWYSLWKKDFSFFFCLYINTIHFPDAHTCLNSWCEVYFPHWCSTLSLAILYQWLQFFWGDQQRDKRCVKLGKSKIPIEYFISCYIPLDMDHSSTMQWNMQCMMALATGRPHSEVHHMRNMETHPWRTMKMEIKCNKLLSRPQMSNLLVGSYGHSRFIVVEQTMIFTF